ncbi:putative ribonuclease H-like domain-containing protein [Tanacetum coccineum]
MSSNNTRSTNGEVTTDHGVRTASTQATVVNLTIIDNLSNVVICAFFASQPNSPYLDNEDLQQINPGDLEEIDLRYMENTRSMPVETTTSNALISCDGLGDYHWSDQAVEGPTNFALMAYSFISSNSEVSTDSNYSSSCLENFKILKEQNEKLLKDLRTSKITAITYKQGLVSLTTTRPVNTARPKAVVNAVRPKVVLNAVKENQCINHSEKGNPQIDLHDQGVFDNRCSRHMTILLTLKKLMEDMLPLEVIPKEGKSQAEVPRKNNMYSVDLKNIVPKGGLTCLFAKATSDESKLWHRRLGHINFKTMNKLVKGNLVRGLPSKLFENDQTCVACQKGKQHRASCKSKTVSSISQPLHMLHMDLFGPTFVKILMKKMHYLVVTDDYSRFSWVLFLATKDKTSSILKSFITGVENLIDQRVKVIRCDNGTEFKNKEINQFCERKGIKREFSVAITPQQNGVAERKNRTLIEAVRTMLADSKLPTTFWAEAVNTACYVQNRVLITKPHNKTPYELFLSRKLALGFMRPFGCLVTILNTIDHLEKFDGKADEGFFVRYSINSKAFRVFNSRTRIVEENMHVQFSENTPNIVGSGPNWLFDIDVLTKLMNYKSVVAGNQSNGNACTKACDDTCKARMETVPSKDYILLPLWTTDPPFSQSLKSSPDVGFKPLGDDEKKVTKEPRKKGSDSSKDGEIYDQEKEDNIRSTNTVNATSTNEVNAFGANTSIELPNMPKLEDIVYSEEPKQVIHALKDPSRIEAIQEELLQFKPQKVWNLVDYPNGKRAIGYTQEEGIDYNEVFALIARIEAIRLFLAYASFRNFMVYQMDVKSAFLYRKIEEEVYVSERKDRQDFVYQKGQRVLATKPHNRTPYEFFLGRKPALRFMRPFGYPVTFLNIDHLGKFDGKADEGFFVGYSINSKAFRVFNSRTMIVEENLHVQFSENTPNIAGSKDRMEIVPGKDYILLPLWLADLPLSQNSKSSPDAGFKPSGDNENKVTKEPGKEGGDPSNKNNSVNSTNNINTASDGNSTNNVNTVSSTVNTAGIEVNTVSSNTSIELPNDLNMPELEDIVYSDDYEDVGVEADMKNLNIFMPISPIPTTRIHKDHPFEQIIRDLNSAPQTRRMTKNLEEHEEPKKMDVKSAFLYGKIEEEVYVCQPPGFEDPYFPDKMISYLALQRSHYAQSFEKMMHKKFQMSSMGELTFFLGLQVKQKEDRFFISQEKYVTEILKKFGFTDVKTTSTPIETQKPLLKDENGKEEDVHLYRSMIGSLMYLTSSRPDIIYLKGQPKLGLWYPKDSPFDLVAYTGSDYAGVSLDRESTTGGCQFLGYRLISWQCKKQTVVANSTTEAEYIVASSCYGQVLWIQNQLLDYGYALTINPTIYTSCIEQFWSTVKAKMVNGEVQLQALVDGKKVIITEAIVKRDLQREDANGVDCLPNALIFE